MLLIIEKIQIFRVYVKHFFLQLFICAQLNVMTILWFVFVFFFVIHDMYFIWMLQILSVRVYFYKYRMYKCVSYCIELFNKFFKQFKERMNEIKKKV